MKFVVDASVAIKWYVPEIYEKESEALLNAGHDFHAPELIYPEFSSIIWKKVRRNLLTFAKGQRIISAFSHQNFIPHSHQSLILSAYTGAEATGQTVYDWTYLALAISLSCEFVTADEKFYKSLAKTSLRANLLWIGDVV